MKSSSTALRQNPCRYVASSRSVVLSCFSLCITFSLGISTAVSAAPEAGPGYTLQRLVPGSPFCGVHGLAVDNQDRLYAGSVVGQRVYRVDTEDGSVRTEVEPPRGMADDLVFLPDGTLIWTSISQNAVRGRKPSGEIYTVADKLVSVNSIAYRKSDDRLFVAQVFGGDGLWEVDPTGEKPPRNILRDIGGLNGFDIGPDGMIYGPLWFKKQVVKIDPDTGEMTVVADGFHTPAAANFDSQWNLYVLDTATGEVFRIDIETGEKHVFARLKTSLDNLAIDSRDQIYVSNMADNSIQRIDAKTGGVSTVVPPALSCATSLAADNPIKQVDRKNKPPAQGLAKESQADTLYLADIFALRSIDGASGEISDIARAHAAGYHGGYPVSVSAGADRFYAISAEGLQVYSKAEQTLLTTWQGMPGLQQVLELPNGDLLGLDQRGTRLTRLRAGNLDDRQTVAEGLNAIADMALSPDGSVYLAQPGVGKLQRLDLRSGATALVTDELQGPLAVAVANSGEVFVLEYSSQGAGDKVSSDSAAPSKNTVPSKKMGRIVSFMPAAASNGDMHQFSLVAEGLPLGRANPVPGVRSGDLALGKSGTIYAVADRENAIYRIEGKR